MSTTTVPRYIIVDDVDSNIKYTGPWFPDQGSQDSAGNFGPAYESTMHGTTANASLSFAFSGTHVKVIGSNNIRNDSGVLDPTWECFIDNISIGASDPFPYAENNWVFCEQSKLLDGSHILTVNATVMKKQTFWIDNIQYVPSANTSLDKAAVVVDSLDPQLQYGQGWQALGGTANMTTVAGTIFNYDFIGISLGWYGFIPKELPITPSPATYSIDGQTPINFQLKGLSSNATTIYNQKFFETAQLAAGSHTLKVVYQGNSSTPLTLDYLIVQNGTSSSTTTSVSSHATSTGSATGNDVSGTSTPGKSSTPVGAIVGGVIGGLVLIVLAILVFFILRRRQKRAAQEEVSISTPKPFDYIHPPSTAPNPSLLGTSYSQAPQTTQMASAVTYGAKERAYHAPMSSLTSMEISQSTQPSSTSSGVTMHPTNLRPIPLQQTALSLANQSSSSVPVSVSSGAASPILPTKTEREAEALAALRTQGRRNPPSVPSSVQSNDTWLPSVVLHADSGIRMPPSTASTSVMDVPPIYTPD